MDHAAQLGWVEIIQPFTNEKMYANLSTGECSWELPPGETAKQPSADQCWQLFDSQSSRFYYYNVALQQSSWLPPSHDTQILPLASLQGFKDVNSEAAMKKARRQTEMKDIATQTSPVDKRYLRRRRYPGNRRSHESSHSEGPSHESSLSEGWNHVTSRSEVQNRELHSDDWSHETSRSDGQSEETEGGANSECTDDADSSVLLVSQSSTSPPRSEVSDVAMSQSSTLPPLSDVPDVADDVTQSMERAADINHLDEVPSSGTATAIGSSDEIQSSGTATAIGSCDEVPSSGTATAIGSCDEVPSSGTATAIGSSNDAVCDTSATSRGVQSHTELPANDECPASVTSRDTEADSKTCSQYTVTSVPAAAMVSCDIEAGSESFSDTVTEVPSSTTTSDDVETSTNTSTVTSVPAEVVTSHDPEAGAKMNISQVSSVPAAAMVSCDNEAGSESFSDTVTEVPSSITTSHDVETSIKTSTVTSVPAEVVTSHDPEAGAKMNISQVSSVPAAATVSCDIEAGSESFNDTVTEVPSSTTTSDDVETSIKTSTVTSVPAEVVTSRDREAGSQAPGAAVTSRDQEAGIKSTSAGSESPGRYVRKKTSAASYAASPLKLTPQSNRRVFPRTNPTYVAAHSSSVDGVSRSSSLRSTDTGLSVESASHDADLSHELSAVSEISSPMRHVRHTSDPFSLNMPVADAVSMETRATTDQSSDQQTTSVSSALPRQFTAGSTSLPSTPQQVRRTLTASTADDVVIDPNIYRHKQTSAFRKFQQVLRRRSLKLDRDAGVVDMPDGQPSASVDTKRGSAPVFGTNSEFAFERYVAENLNDHKQGIFRQSVSTDSMLSWTKDAISRPMLRTSNKLVKREAVEVFKQVQVYMGDRIAKTSPTHAALEVVSRGWTNRDLRDEVYVQLCRQTNSNPKRDSLQRGWELMGISLAFFPPSSRLSAFLEGYLYRHVTCDDTLLSQYAVQCQRRLESITKTGAKRGLKPPTLDEVTQSLHSMFHPSMFGATLSDVMQMQAERFPGRQLPWIQTTLSEQVLKLNGPQTEGIFRVSGDVDEVNASKVLCDQWQLPPPASTSTSASPHTAASLLKLWFRELAVPLIPHDLYLTAITQCDDVDACVALVSQLPQLNRLVLTYLVHFLQVFVEPDNVSVTKMDVSNLAMVWAPNCLRCQSTDPLVVFENARKEMSFMRLLIDNLDTKSIDTVLPTCPCCQRKRLLVTRRLSRDDENALMF